MTCNCCQFQQIEKQIRKLRQEMRAMRFLVLQPNKPALLVTKKDDMAISFAVILPVPPAAAKDWNEIAGGRLSVMIAGGEPIVIGTTKDQQETETRVVSDELFVGPQGSMVAMEFCYIDDAGNPGPSVTALAMLMDTVPPVAPGQLGLIATGEE